MRTRQYSNGDGSRWIGAVGRPHIANSPPIVRQLSADPRFQIVFERNGARQTTDVPLTGFDIARLGVEAEVRDIGMVRLLSEVVTTAIKKNMIKEILGSRAGGAG